MQGLLEKFLSNIKLGTLIVRQFQHNSATRGYHLHRFALLAVIVAKLLLAGSTSGAEIRTYRFVPDGSLPYSLSCGECGPPYLGAASDIAGTFTVELDFEASTGSLVDLNDNLVNYFNVLSSPSGPTLESATPVNPGIIPSWAIFFAPPFDGSLESTSAGFTLSSDDFSNPFEIAVSGPQAVFSLVVPIVDYYITVTDAIAVQVPEPIAVLSAAPPLLFLVLMFRNRRRA